MPEEKMVAVSWYNCNCDFITKYCTEHHRSHALVPVEILNKYVKQAVTDVKKRRTHA